MKDQRDSEARGAKAQASAGSFPPKHRCDIIRVSSPSAHPGIPTGLETPAVSLPRPSVVVNCSGSGKIYETYITVAGGRVSKRTDWPALKHTMPAEPCVSFF